MKDITKIVKSLKDSGLLLKGVTETVRNEVKEQKGGFVSMLLRTLSANLLGNVLAGKGAKTTSQGRGINRAGEGRKINKTGKGREINRAGEGIVRAGYGRRSFKKMDF